MHEKEYLEEQLNRAVVQKFWRRIAEKQALAERNETAALCSQLVCINTTHFRISSLLSRLRAYRVFCSCVQSVVTRKDKG